MFRRGKLPFVSTKDDRIKIFNERINLTEKHALEIATIFADCARKTAKHRDTFDELAKSLKNYADDEEINESLSEGLKSFTNAITILGDYMDLSVHRLQLKVVNELAQFENICKSTRDTLRSAVVARDKEVLKQRQMMEIKTKFSANNSAADSELFKSKLEVNRTNKEIDEILTNFEKRKLSELKATFTDFILLSIKYHTKALEVLSASYYDVACNIDEKGDLLEFQKLMKTKEEFVQSSRKAALKKGLRSQSMESLDRDQLLSPIKRTSRLSRSTKNLSEKSEDEIDVDEEDDDAEEESSDDNSNENESGSASEDEVDDDASESHSEGKADPKSTTSKKSTKQHFKAQPLASTNIQKPFAARLLPQTGIPKRTLISSYVNSESLNAGTSGSGRLVTVVESKKKSLQGKGTSVTTEGD